MRTTIFFLALLVVGPQLLRFLLKSFLWRSPNQLALAVKSFILSEFVAFAGFAIWVGFMTFISSPEYPQIWILVTAFFLTSYVLFSNTNLTLQTLFPITLLLMIFTYSLALGTLSTVKCYYNFYKVFLAGLFLAFLLRGILWIREATQKRT